MKAGHSRAPPSLASEHTAVQGLRPTSPRRGWPQPGHSVPQTGPRRSPKDKGSLCSATAQRWPRPLPLVPVKHAPPPSPALRRPELRHEDAAQRSGQLARGSASGKAGAGTGAHGRRGEGRLGRIPGRSFHAPLRGRARAPKHETSGNLSPTPEAQMTETSPCGHDKRVPPKNRPGTLSKAGPRHHLGPGSLQHSPRHMLTAPLVFRDHRRGRVSREALDVPALPACAARPAGAEHPALHPTHAAHAGGLMTFPHRLAVVTRGGLRHSILRATLR